MISLILLSYYYAYRVGKDLVVILIVFVMILDSFLNDFGGHIGTAKLMSKRVPVIRFWNGLLAHIRYVIPDNAKPMSRRMRRRCQD